MAFSAMEARYLTQKCSTTAPMRWAIIQIPSMAIDGPSMPIGKVAMAIDGPSMAHRWTIDGPSMGFDGPIDGIEWSLSTGYYSDSHNSIQMSLWKSKTGTK